MLVVDMRELAHGPVDTTADLAPNDPLFDGLHPPLTEPVRVRGRLQAAGDGQFYWTARLTTQVATECRRCLSAVRVPVEAQVYALFAKEPEALEDPEAYPVAREATAIDLRPAVREELLLDVPQWVLCRADCRGLCPRCGKDLNAGPCGCPPVREERWAALAALRDKFRD